MSSQRFDASKAEIFDLAAVSVDASVSSAQDEKERMGAADVAAVATVRRGRCQALVGTTQGGLIA